MKSRLAAVACALAAAGLTVACGSASTAGEREQAARIAAPSWASVAAELRPTLEPSSTDPCQRGAPVCLAILVSEMQRRARVLVAACSHDAPFAVTYEQMTAAIAAAAKDGQFKNPALMTLFTAWFANKYLTAFDAWRAGNHGAVPAAWQTAFTAADEHSVSALGDLLLGMNAHITHDLPSAVAAVMRQPGTQENPDYARVNQIIVAISQGVLSQLASHLDPALSLAQIPLALGGASSFGELISQWRNESWRNGIALRDAGSARAAVQAQIDGTADLRAAAISAATAYLPLIEDSAARDGYCAAHHGSDWP